MVEEKDMLKGYLRQCAEIQKYLEPFIDQQLSSGKSLIIEGVHLNIEFYKRMIQKYEKKCQGFIIKVPQYEAMGNMYEI